MIKKEQWVKYVGKQLLINSFFLHGDLERGKNGSMLT